MRVCPAICVLLILGCRQADKSLTLARATYSITIPDSSIAVKDTLLALQNGIWFYGKHIYSGHILTRYPSGQVKTDQSIFAGKEEQLTKSYYEDGKKEALRYYHLGEKDSVHTGWWPNGNKQFEYHFKMGAYHGSFKEWYNSGKPLKVISYLDGKEQSGKGWRENGKTYMSFVMRNGRLYGSVNPNLCYSLKNEKGEFRNSP